MGLVLAFIGHMFLTYSVDNRALNHVMHASSSSWLQEHMTDISERLVAVLYNMYIGVHFADDKTLFYR